MAHSTQTRKTHDVYLTHINHTYIQGVPEKNARSFAQNKF